MIRKVPMLRGGEIEGVVHVRADLSWPERVRRPDGQAYELLVMVVEPTKPNVPLYLKGAYVSIADDLQLAQRTALEKGAYL